MGWKCIAIHWFVLQAGRLGWLSVSQYTGVYCDIVAGRVSCIAIGRSCIAEKRAETVSQYSSLYCD